MDRLSTYPLPSEDRAPALARGHLRDIGADWPDEVLASALIATSELVTNAVRHGAGDVCLVVHASPDHLRVEVHDRGDKPAALQAGDGDDARRRGSGRGARRQGRDWQTSEGGRGLVIVDALARRWGVIVAKQPPGKAVWFEMGASIDVMST